MFRGLSESRDFPPGKKMSSIGYAHRRHQLEMGVPEWQQNYLTATKILHNQKPISSTKINHEARNQSHFDLRPEHLKDQKYYMSEKTDKFKDFTNQRQANQRINKQEILKTTLLLGEDGGNYSTQNNIQYYDKSQIQLPDIKWKPQRERYDIITNNDVNKERLGKACAFDFWNEKAEKKRITRNYTYIPKDNEVIDVITGRIRRIR